MEPFDLHEVREITHCKQSDLERLTTRIHSCNKKPTPATELVARSSAIPAPPRISMGKGRTTPTYSRQRLSQCLGRPAGEDLVMEVGSTRGHPPTSPPDRGIQMEDGTFAEPLVCHLSPATGRSMEGTALPLSFFRWGEAEPDQGECRCPSPRSFPWP
jgi:hypothetical protein